MSLEGEGAKRKWKCKYCTYENFPSSIKCTMCREDKVLASLNSDIYQLAYAGTSLCSNDNEELASDKAIVYPKSQRQLSPSSNVSPPPDQVDNTLSSSNTHTQFISPQHQAEIQKSHHAMETKKQTVLSTEPQKSLNLAVAETNKPASVHSSETRISPISVETNNVVHNPVAMETSKSSLLPITTSHDLHESLKPLKISESPPPTGGRNLSLEEHTRKWSCVRCTYENWPRATRCVMCNASPRISPLTALSPMELENSASAVKCIDDNRQERRSAYRHRSEDTTPHTSPYTTAKVPHHLHTHNQNEHERRYPNNKNYEHDHRHSMNNYDHDHRVNNYEHERRIPNNYELERRIPNNYELERRIPNNYDRDRRVRARKSSRSPGDWAWLNACSGIVSGDYGPVHAYLARGGDPARQLSSAEVALLNRSSAFSVGLTLVHLAIRFQREDILATLLSHIEGSGNGRGVKRVPSYVAPDLAADIRRHVAACMRQRKSSLPCVFVTDITTFTLPAEIEDLPPSIQEQLFEELLDKEAQQQLEAEPHPVINWSHEVTAHLYALWNRSAGDCLLDSLMQATWGVFDRENVLRRALADSLVQASHLFYPRWKEYEDMHASLLNFSLDEAQWQDDWASLVSLASQPGAALEQLHVFVLAHILRRPIIVYGVKYVKSFRGEDIGFARFEGVYLPLLWDPGFCSRSPLCLGYTRGHFSALLSLSSAPLAPPSGARNIATPIYLPLMDHERKLLPIHFVTHNEIGREETLLKQWLDVGLSESGLLVAQQRTTQPPLLVAQMVEEWLNHYRRLQQMSSAPFSRPIRVQDFSSDESDGDE